MGPRTHRWRLVPSVLLCVTLIAAAGCASEAEPLSWKSVETLIAEEFPDVRSVTTAELARALRTGEPPVVLLDVRESEEFAVSHLENAHWVYSAHDAASIVARAHPSDLVVAYCSVGYRSAATVAELRRRGHENVVNLEGSIFAWANEGRPVYRAGTLVDGVHPFDEVWGELLSPGLRFRVIQE